jgi:hypothetical protein
MYKIVPWSLELDLKEFYSKAEKKGYKNNSNEQSLVRCFDNEKEKQVWILYYNDKPIGSVAAHSFEIMGENSYRICARTCVITEDSGMSHLRPLKKGILDHQHITAQIFIPTCIKWCSKSSNLYITSNESETGSQRLVHTIFCPAMEKIGVLEFKGNHFYRGLEQAVWKLNVLKFYQELDRVGRWKYV